jgi:catechol 2,3-dioxygenase-like lactoylglutathione lyase family enzyme
MPDRHSLPRLGLVTFLVHDYDPAIVWFTGSLGFALLEDTDLGGGKRWVRVAPSQAPHGPALLLARATTPEQIAAISNPAGGRVAFFLEVPDIDAAWMRMTAAGVVFREAIRRETYGRVCVFEDLYGAPWDLIGPA